MKSKKDFACLLSSFLLSFGVVAPIAHSELIVLAAPAYNDKYYSEASTDIFNFHIRYANQVKAPDQVLILTDEKTYKSYAQVLGDHKVAIAEMDDIWLRDFSLSNPEQPILMRYSSAGQGGNARQSKRVQKILVDIMKRAELEYTQSNLINDGGNFVGDTNGNVIISRKFLADNKLSEDEGRQKLLALPGINRVAFIDADEQGGLEHADGVLSFIDNNVLLVNTYEEDKAYANALKADIRASMPNVKIVEVITPYDDSIIYDKKFGSACGLYTNALVTPTRIYFPQFGTPNDKIALKQITAATNKEIVLIESSTVCYMGGGVRCMSWQLRGANATRLLQYFGKGQE